MLIGLVNHWFTAEGCNKVSAMTTVRKATIGSAVGIQPRRKASRFSLSKGSEAGCEVVVHRYSHCLAAIRCLWASSAAEPQRTLNLNTWVTCMERRGPRT